MKALDNLTVWVALAVESGWAKRNDTNAGDFYPRWWEKQKNFAWDSENNLAVLNELLETKWGITTPLTMPELRIAWRLIRDCQSWDELETLPRRWQGIVFAAQLEQALTKGIL